MKVAEEIEKMIKEYPSLFKTRYAALDHLFCVIGNGYDWINGELVYTCIPMSEEEKIVRKKERKKHEKLLYKVSKALGGNHLEKRKVEEKAEKLAIKNAKIIANTPFYDKITKDYKFYPICDYSAIMNLPKDIKDDWKAAAEETEEYIRRVK